jgi:hypothetical protein
VPEQAQLRSAVVDKCSQAMALALDEAAFWEHFVLDSTALAKIQGFRVEGPMRLLGLAVARALTVKKEHPCSLLVCCLGASSTDRGKPI